METNNKAAIVRDAQFMVEELGTDSRFDLACLWARDAIRFARKAGGFNAKLASRSLIDAEQECLDTHKRIEREA